MDAATQLTDIQFSERRRGYDPDEVDSFLEKLGDAVVKLQDKVSEANRRADEAEKRIAEAPKADEDQLGETLKKTLLLAQKTADQTVDEAKAEAQRLLDEAKGKADDLLRKAEEQREKLVSGAEREAREAAEAAARPVREVISRLSAQRDGLTEDVGLLERHLEGVRERLRAGVDELLGLLEDPERFRTGDGPKVAERPAPEASGRSAPRSGPTGIESGDKGAIATSLPGRPTEPPGQAPGAPGAGRSGAGSATKEAPAGGIFPVKGDPVEKAPSPESDSGGPVEPGAKDSAQNEPGGEARAVGDAGFLTELKRAVSEESELGPVDPEADEAMKAFFETDLDEGPKRSRFGRRH